MNDHIMSKSKIISVKLAKKFIIFLVVVFIFDFFLFPVPVMAGQTQTNEPQVVQDSIIEETLVINNNLPDNNEIAIKKTGIYEITAYTSEAAQTDNTPCITANGFNLCEHGQEDSVAANFLPFGAKIKMPDLFGDKVFVVRDRMNSRYYDRVDIWMVDKADAINFGLKITKIEILEEP
jgi:3D (Asp-Asp-Asp) domain-containing protein